MQQRNLAHKLSALGVFLCSYLVYLLTLPPTLTFWDVGEFIAASYLLQVPHPPGSPFFLLLGRIITMIPFVSDVAVRAHMLSALGSSFTIMFLYLVAVRLIVSFRGNPNNALDRFLVYGSAIIGALSLGFCYSFWFNATEAEVYGLSMLFVALIIWLIMRWYDLSDEPHNEKYILVIAYLIGLSVGVHLLAVLTIFTVLMIVYFKRFEINRATFIIYSIISVLVFFIVYPGVVKYLPSMLDGEFGVLKGKIVQYLPILITLGALYGIYYSTKHKLKNLNIALISFLLIVLGYSTYTMVIIRANVKDLPMNENDPSNIARLVSYLNREQYGEAPVLQRRYSNEPMHAPTWNNYRSDMDFMIKYQINHMYIRYLLWNYVGMVSDIQDSGVTWKYTLGIPFLIGLLGLFYHFKRDWKMALPFLTLFIVMGVLLALYQNQQEPQPRERDYFYVGSFFVFSIFIAIGIVAIADYVRKWLKREQMLKFGIVSIVIILLFLVPINMARTNWHRLDRSKNYVAWDYSYNMLQTCEKDAIIFTNGDNDTFPLWYLQDVEGIRQDVRIVNLSLVNTNWYIKQLKNYSPHGAKKVPISFTDAQIDRLQPVVWETRKYDLPVSEEVYRKFGITDTAITNQKKISFTMSHTISFGTTKAIKVQDIMVRDIIMTNKWERPIYFAVTVAPDSKIGLDDYLWMDGLAWRLKPVKADQETGINKDIMEANLMAENVVVSKEPQYGYIFRNLNNPDVYFDENVTRLTVNYRSAFMRLALFYYNVEQNSEKAKRVLEKLDSVIPLEVIEMDWRLAADVMLFFGKVGLPEKEKKYSDYVEKKAWELINLGKTDINSYYSPYRVLLELYENRKDYLKAIDILNRVSVYYPNDPAIKNRISDLQKLLKVQSDTGK